MRTGRSLLIGLLGICALTLTFCSRDRENVVLAKVGDRLITLDKFEELYQKVDKKNIPGESREERLQNFLETLVQKEIMAIKADELGYDKDPQVVRGMSVFRRLGLQGAYLKFYVADKVEITEDKMREYYENINTTIAMKQIIVDTMEEAEEVYRQLEDGNDFESVCRQYSKGDDAEQGGKVTNAKFNLFPPQYRDELRDKGPGGYTRPLLSPMGYVIVKVVKVTKPKHSASYDEMKAQVRDGVRGLEEMRLVNEVNEEMRRKAGVEWNMDNIRIAFEALPPDRPPTNPPRRDEEKYPLLKFDEADLGRPLVTYKNKSVTLGDFSDMYDRTSFFERPRRAMRLGGIRGFLLRSMMNELITDEMERSRIEEKPEVREILETKQEELMVHRMHDDLVTSQTVVKGEEIKSYYRDNIERYRTPEKRRFGVILAGSRSTAQEARDVLEQGVPLAEVAKLYSIDEMTRDRGGETDLVAKGNQPEVDEVGFALAEIGDISEPFETSKGWVVMKLMEKAEERTLSLEEVKEAVERDIKRMKEDERLKGLIAKWKKGMSVDVHEEHLKKVRVDGRETTDAG